MKKQDVVDKCIEFLQILQMPFNLKESDVESSVMSLSDSLELIITEFDTHIFIMSSIKLFINGEAINVSGPIYTIFKDEEKNVSSLEFGKILIYFRNFQNWVNQLHAVLENGKTFQMPIKKMNKIIKTLLNENVTIGNTSVTK